MLAYLIERLKKRADAVSGWFEEYTKIAGPDPIYASVDLRNAGYKIAPVDTNIFPAGFNNLCPSYRRNAGGLFRTHIDTYYAGAKKIVILAEEHTRNLYYFEHLFYLVALLKEAGFTVKIASLSHDLPQEKNEFLTAEKNTVTIWKAHVTGYLLHTKTLTPEIILVNNDFSAGIPSLIKKIVQPLIPTPLAGWHTRRKSHHFYHYEKCAQEFCRLIDIDPWLITAQYACMGQIDFSDDRKMVDLGKKVDSILDKIRKKYHQYGIKKTPYVFVKNDAGTYGMAVMTTDSGEEFLHLNKKQRSRMKIGKGSTLVTEVIIQEGLPTIDRFKGAVAEPVMYLIDNKVCGGFFRLHEAGDELGNLNQPGMKFTKMCFHEMTGYGIEYEGKCDLAYLSIMYKHIARIASLAAGLEIKHATFHEDT